MKKQSGLGRGLGALLEDPNLEFTQQKGGVTSVPLHQVEPNPLQPRKNLIRRPSRPLRIPSRLTV